MIKQITSVLRSKYSIYIKWVMIKKIIGCKDGYIATYGSGFNTRSFEKSGIKCEFSHFESVDGYKRRFAHETSRIGGGCYLDVVKCEGFRTTMAVFKVDKESMANFIVREGNYEYCYTKSGALYVGTDPDETCDKMPRLDYLQAVIHGLNKLGGDVDEFLDTTFLHDEITTVRQWLDSLDIVELFKQYDSAY